MFNDLLRILEAILTAKPYNNRDEVISTASLLVGVVHKVGNISTDMDKAYQSALQKLKTLRFDEMLQIIEYVESKKNSTDYPEQAADDDPNGERVYHAAMDNYRHERYQIAAQMFKNAAAKNHPKATYDYALCLYSGIGLISDKVFAIKLFVAAAALGVPEADRMLRFIADENEQMIELLGR